MQDKDCQLGIDLAPIFEAFGFAIYRAQELERGIHLLKELADNYVTSALPDVRVDIEKPAGRRTVGQLFKELKDRGLFTEEDVRVLDQAIELRNFLVHRFFARPEHVLATLKPKGRWWLRNTLLAIAAELGQTSRRVTGFINEYLGERGSSIESLSAPLWEEYESDLVPKPPADILH